MNARCTPIRISTLSLALLALCTSVGAGGVKTWKGSDRKAPTLQPQKTPFTATHRPLTPPIPAQHANAPATYWTNLLVASSREHQRWYAARTWRDAQSVLEREADFAAQNGFGSWGLFEFGPHEVLHEQSGWDRPLQQFSEMSAMRKRALKGAIAHAHELGLEVHGYVGTLGPDGEDMIPAANSFYLDELTLMAEAGFDRMYIDATSWNSGQSNEYRPLGVGGGARRDGIIEIRTALTERGIAMEVGVEAWPGNGSGRLLPEGAPALAAGYYLTRRYNQGRVDMSSAAGDTNFRIVIFNLHQDADHPETLRELAQFGFAFDAGGNEPGLIELVTELNTMAEEARETLPASD